MRMFPVLALFAALVGASVVTKNLKSGGNAMIPTRDEIAASINTQIMSLKDAKIKEINCGLIDVVDSKDGGHCYVSPLKPDEILPLLVAVIGEVGHTNGWTNDYSVWGAFYASKQDPKRSFGVNISPIEGNRDFEQIGAVKGYKSFIDFVVNSTRRP